ncbi:hypothetical protein [Salana multivorans]|nr:hypothetical protein [Salana multivorans]
MTDDDHVDLTMVASVRALLAGRGLTADALVPVMTRGAVFAKRSSP